MKLLLRLRHLLPHSLNCYLASNRVWLLASALCSSRFSIFSGTPGRRSFSVPSTPLPTPDQIASLILDQKSEAQVIQTFRWASNLPKFSHNQSTYRALVHKLCTFRSFDTAKMFLDEMPQSIGSPPGEDIFITFIRGLGRARAIQEVINVIDLVLRYDHTLSVKILNSILDVLVKEDIDSAREFFRKNIAGGGFEVDIYTFGILMKGLCLTNRIADAFKLLQVMKSHALVPNTVIYNTLLHALCRNSKTGRARGLMNKMLEPNQVTFNILISGYCQEQNLVQAFVMLEKCFHLGFLPDIRVVTKLLEALCKAGRLDEAFEIFQRVDERGGVVDVVAYNTLINGFCKSGKTKAAQRLLKEMEAKGYLPNVKTYNLLISGFCEHGLLDSALGLFRDMKMDGINYNFTTYDVLIRALCSNGRTEDGFRILEIMEDSGGSKYRISPYNSIIYGLYSENHWEDARAFLEKLGRMFPRVVHKSLRIVNFCKEENMRDAVWVYQQMISEGGAVNALVYSGMIWGFCKQGNLREAFDLANEMVSSGYLPAASTVNSIVSGFCRQGHVRSAVNLLEDLATRGWMLDERSYGLVISELCKRGNLDQAFSVLVRMIENKITPDCSIWTSILPAFVLFKKIKTNDEGSLLRNCTW